MIEGVDLVWKALADPTRRRLMDLLRERARTTGELCTSFEPSLSRFAVMKHLRTLERAGLVVVRHQGRESWHFLNAVPLRRIYDHWVSKYDSRWAESLLQLKSKAEQQNTAKKEATTMETIHIEQEILIEEGPGRVFDALTTDVDAWWNQGFFTPNSIFRLEANVGGRFYEDFGVEKGGTLYATVTYIKKGEKLRMIGPMGMSGAVMGAIDFALESRDGATLLKLSHHIIGEVDGTVQETYTNGWQELLSQNLKIFVEQGRGYRAAS